MPFIQMLPDPGMNYTLNRPLLDGSSPARMKEIGAVAPRIKDYGSWQEVWLELATTEEALGGCCVLLSRRRILPACGRSA